MALLDEAVERAARASSPRRRPELNDAERAAIARAGRHRRGEVRRPVDRRTTATTSSTSTGCSRSHGNTGPYLQYAAARIRSIFRKAGADAGGERRAGAPDRSLGEPAERALALALLGFGAVVAQVGDSLEPHRLCAYLFELAQAFTAFYEQCPVLQAADPAGAGLAAGPVGHDARRAGPGPGPARHPRAGGDVTGRALRAAAPRDAEGAVP